MNIERELYSKISPVIPSPEAIIITGMRRVGKTTLLKYIQAHLPSSNVLYLDLENPLNRKYFEEQNYDRILDAFRLLGLDTQKSGYVLLDEIQFVRNLPSVVKYLSDAHKIKFFLSGSASFYLKNLFTESLAGRKYLFELYPLSFREFLKLRDPEMVLPPVESSLSQAMFGRIDRRYDEYVNFGGFPGVVLKDSVQEKKLALEDIFTSYFQLEVGQLSDFRKTSVVRDLILLLMERVGSRLDVSTLSRELGVSRITVNDYLAFLEKTYFIHLVKPFSRNRSSEIRGAAKVYLCDTGLLNHMARVASGTLLENAVFLALRRTGAVNYYQKKNGVEIDFIRNGQEAFEVKNLPHAADLNRLTTLGKELKLESCRLVSKRFVTLPQTTFGFQL